jgi:hypothetical protein
MCAVSIFQSARAGRRRRRPAAARRTHAAAGAVGWSQLMRRAVMHRIGFSLLLRFAGGPFDFGSFSVQVFELCVLYGFLHCSIFYRFIAVVW